MASEAGNQLAAQRRAEETARDVLVKEIRVKAQRDEAAKTGRLRELRMMKEAAERAGAQPLKRRV